MTTFLESERAQVDLQWIIAGVGRSGTTSLAARGLFGCNVVRCDEVRALAFAVVSEGVVKAIASGYRTDFLSSRF